MNYKVKKTSKTGKKLQTLFERMQFCNQQQENLAKVLGAVKWRGAPLAVAGGLSTLVLPKHLTKQHWKRIKGTQEYKPRLTTSKGKDISKKMSELPNVSYHELNQVVNCDKILNNIGMYSRNKDYFLLDIPRDWQVRTPKDCKEITVEEYERLKKEVK